MSTEQKKQKKQKFLEVWSTSKEQLCLDWIEMTNEQRNVYFEQGEIIKCSFGENIGYEICKSRPCLVISDTRYNNDGQLVIIPLTKKVNMLKTHCFLSKKKYDFLEFDSCVKTEQIKSVSSIRIEEKMGKIDDVDMTRVKVRLKTLFNI